MSVDEFLIKIADQAPWFVIVLIVIWLSLPSLAERFAIVGKLVGPLSKKWREKAERLERERRDFALKEARREVQAVMKELTPPDIRRMEQSQNRLAQRLMWVEDSEDMLKAFVTYDELWHFHDDNNEARRGRRPAHRMSFESFETKWKQGWRPFDNRGQYTGDTGSQGELPNDDRETS